MLTAGLLRAAEDLDRVRGLIETALPDIPSLRRSHPMDVNRIVAFAVDNSIKTLHQTFKKHCCFYPGEVGLLFLCCTKFLCCTNLFLMFSCIILFHGKYGFLFQMLDRIFKAIQTLSAMTPLGRGTWRPFLDRVEDFENIALRYHKKTIVPMLEKRRQQQKDEISEYEMMVDRSPSSVSVASSSSRLFIFRTPRPSRSKTECCHPCREMILQLTKKVDRMSEQVNKILKF